MESFDLAALVRPVSAEGAIATAVPQAPDGANAAQIGAFVAAFLAEAQVAPGAEATNVDAATAKATAIPASLALTGRQDAASGQGLLGTDVNAPMLRVVAPSEAPNRSPVATMPAAREAGLRGAEQLGDGPAATRVTPEQQARVSSLLQAQDFDARTAPAGDTSDSSTRPVPRTDAAFAEQRSQPGFPGAESATHLSSLRTAGGEVVQGTYTGRPAALPMNDPALFGERLNQQIAIMVSQNNNHARIAVSPPELGPVEVRVTVVGDEAAIQLAATSPATREALEEALPRLRAAFADSGVSLGDTGVFAELPDQRPQPRDGDPEPGGARAQTLSEPEAEDTTPRLRHVSLALVDAFV